MSTENFYNYQKTKQHLICVDSDGCAMDTMEAKHRQCFCPLIISIWKLEIHSQQIEKLWYNINLYSGTRGVNRFKGLSLTFKALEKENISVEGVQSLYNWVEKAQSLSISSLKEEIDINPSSCLKNTLLWSEKVNQRIADLLGDDKPFPNVKQTISILSGLADIVVVSSANTTALQSEWTRHKLMPSVKLLLGQEAGTKEDCIRQLLGCGYAKDNTLMVGDSPGDLSAAQDNGIHFYPILVGKEAWSWERLGAQSATRFIENKYSSEYQNALKQEFNKNLIK